MRKRPDPPESAAMLNLPKLEVDPEILVTETVALQLRPTAWSGGETHYYSPTVAHIEEFVARVKEHFGLDDVRDCKVALTLSDSGITATRTRHP